LSFFNELKRRNVLRVGIAYVIVAWIIAQVLQLAFETFVPPDWVMKTVLVLLATGLPIALFFAWAFELTPEGLKREKDVNRNHSVTQTTGRKIDFLIIGMLAIAVVFLLADNYVFNNAEELVSATTDSPDQSTDLVSTYNSIGVLPFVNMSNDPDQEYFSDGIAEELLNALAKLKNLQVAARTSSFAFKGQNLDIGEIGNKLKVDTVLEGSVRKSGNRLRITAQLIDVSNGYHLWSETYDRELTDVFAIQDEITGAIVAALRLHFDTGETPAVAKSEATNIEAYDAYLQGRHQLRGLGVTPQRAALVSFRAATDADPDFAAAWAARGLTVMLLRQTDFRGDIPREEARLLARSNIDRALALDPMQAEAHVAEGMLLADDYKYEAALVSLEKAVSINPSLAEAWTWRGRILGRFGRIKEARKSLLTALKLDPLHEGTAFFAVSLAADFYDPEFLAAVGKSGKQFPDIKEWMEDIQNTNVYPLTAEVYKRYVASMEEGGRRLAETEFYELKEIDEVSLSQVSRQLGEYLMWIYMSIDHWDEAQAMYDELSPERQQAAINLEELSVMQTSMGQCELARESLQRAHSGEVRIYGLIGPNAERSNSNLALNQVYCLRQLGVSAKAENILSQARVYVETLRENADWGFSSIDAKLRVLDGDIEGALDVLEIAIHRAELGWTTRYDPILRTLSDEPRFRALFTEVDQGIKTLREDLGMPPAEL